MAYGLTGADNAVGHVVGNGPIGGDAGLKRSGAFDDLKGALLLAPMAGVTDMPFRLLCFEHGCPMAYTEMISAKGLMMNPAHYLSASGVSGAARLLLKRPSERLGVQIFGSDPGCMAEAAALLSDMGFYCLDINMGCPAPKITSGGEGSALHKTPELAERIVKAVADAARIPVTVKMRAGWDRESVNCVDMAKAMEQCGARMITVHGRTRMDFYQGTADRGFIHDVVRAVRVPVVGNGDIRTPEDAARMQEETGCHAVMIGRGAQGNPFIFKQYAAYLRDGSCIEPSMDARVSAAIRHLRMLSALCGERMAALEMRKHAAWYLRGARNATALRRGVNAAQNPEEMIAALSLAADTPGDG